MTRSTVTTLRCDRCGTALVLDEAGDDRAEWGRAAVESTAGSRVGPPGEADDLCPLCLRGLLGWYRGPVVEVPPPPPPPPLRREPFTLDDRQRAIVLVEAGLKDRIAIAMAAVREAPTEILSGGIVPGAMFGITETAAGIVDGVLDQLGLARGRRTS